MSQWPTEVDDTTSMALHIGFEIQMLGSLPRLVEQFDNQGEVMAHVACLESALLHSRALIEFLFGRPGQGGQRTSNRRDASPDQFGTSWVSRDPARFDGWLNLIDKNIMHLSLSRPGAGTVQEHYLTDIVDGLLAEVADLVAALARDGSPYLTQFQAAYNQAHTQRLKGPLHWPTA